MPCMDYQDSRLTEDLIERNNELTRYACIFAAALERLLKDHHICSTETDMLAYLLDNPTEYDTAAMEWWKQHKKDAAAERARLTAVAELKKRGHAVVKRLSREERDALRAIGVQIKEPVKKSSVKKTKK